MAIHVSWFIHIVSLGCLLEGELHLHFATLRSTCKPSVFTQLHSMEDFPPWGRCKLTVRGGFNFIEMGSRDRSSQRRVARPGEPHVPWCLWTVVHRGSWMEAGEQREMRSQAWS